MEWKDEYATGIRNIDDQHRQIVHLATAFERLPADAADWTGVHALILRTSAYLQYHFAVEEALMRLLPQGDNAIHRAEHRAVLAALAELENNAREGIEPAALAPLMRHLLLDHLRGSDLRFAARALAQWRRFGED